MAKVASKGFARAREIYENPEQRVKELKAEGKKVMGYLCIYPIIEMLTAFDLVPFRIFGDMREVPSKIDIYMPITGCPFLRSLTDLGMKGKFDFLDGMIFASICEVGRGIPTLWRNTINTPYTHYIVTPHTIRTETMKEMQGVVRDFQKSLEEYTGKKLTPAKLKAAIVAHNQQRALVQELYELKKPDPPRLSGTETLMVLKAVTHLPVKEGSQLLREVISEVKARKNGSVKKSARLLIWGSVIDDISFTEMIESLDANIVIDDTCVGTRAFFPNIPLTDDPIEGLAHHYLMELKCPRTYRDSIYGATKKDHITDLETRFAYLKNYAKDWKANGAILAVMRFCDCHGYEVPGLKDYFEHIGLPSMYLERDYSEASLAPMKTRVQGFLEVMS